MKSTQMLFSNVISDNWLHCLIVTFMLPMFVSMSKNEVFSLSVDDNFMTSSAPQEMACHDVFDPNQCIFVERLLKIIVNRFDEKIEAEKDNFKKQINEINSQLEQISSKILYETDARRSENMKIRTEIRNPKKLEIIKHSGFSNNSKVSVRCCDTQYFH